MTYSFRVADRTKLVLDFLLNHEEYYDLIGALTTSEWKVLFNLAGFTGATDFSTCVTSHALEAVLPYKELSEIDQYANNNDTNQAGSDLNAGRYPWCHNCQKGTTEQGHVQKGSFLCLHRKSLRVASSVTDEVLFCDLSHSKGARVETESSSWKNISEHLSNLTELSSHYGLHYLVLCRHTISVLTCHSTTGGYFSGEESESEEGEDENEEEEDIEDGHEEEQEGHEGNDGEQGQNGEEEEEEGDAALPNGHYHQEVAFFSYERIGYPGVLRMTMALDGANSWDEVAAIINNRWAQLNNQAPNPNAANPNECCRPEYDTEYYEVIDRFNPEISGNLVTYFNHLNIGWMEIRDRVNQYAEIESSLYGLKQNLALYG